MIRGKKWRRPRIALAGALAATAVMAVGAGSAQAAPQPFHASFDDAALNVGATFDILDPPNTATLTGTHDPTNDAVVVASPGGFVAPEFQGDPITGLHVIVNFAPLGATDITGTLTPAGALTLNSHAYRAVVNVNGTADCTYDTSMAFSTGPGTPFNGHTFTVGTPDTTITQGIMQTSWPSLTADPNPACGLVNGLVANPGGLEFGNGFDLTPATPAAPSGGTVAPAPKKKCKKKKKKKSGAQIAKKKCKKKKKK